MLPILPVHPKPAWQESISSYLIRMSNVNGFTSLQVFLRQLFYTRRKFTSSFYEPLRWDFMPPNQITNLEIMLGHTADELRVATFSYLVEVSLDLYDYMSSFTLLRPYLTASFSYCPTCIQQYKYYFLFWRIKGNPGCPEHGLKLVSKCYRCSAPLPLPLRCDNARIGQCPFCNADLSMAPAHSLDSKTYDEAQEFQDSLCHLFSPQAERKIRPLELEFRRSHFRKKNVKVFRVNWDLDLPESREFIAFKGYYQHQWGPLSVKLSQTVENLFSLYWLGSVFAEAAALYIQFRDNTNGINTELNRRYRYLLGSNYFCRDRSVVNRDLPSLFEVYPIAMDKMKLKKLIVEIKLAMTKLQVDLFYDPAIADVIATDLASQLSAWQRQLAELSPNLGENETTDDQ